MELYAVHKNGKKYLLFTDVGKESEKAGMTTDKYIQELRNMNPQFLEVYAE